MKRFIILVLSAFLSVLAMSQFVDEMFKYECYYITYSPGLYLHHSCEKFENPKSSQCSNEENINNSEVFVLKFLCKRKLHQFVINLDILKNFKNLIVLDTTYLGIVDIGFVKSSDYTSTDENTEWKESYMAAIKKWKKSFNEFDKFFDSISNIDESFEKNFMLNVENFNSNFQNSKKFSHISKVNCSFNMIEYIGDFSALPKLEVLDLSYNKIKYIYGNAFANNKYLRVLILGNNPLKMINVCKLFSSLCNLEILDLSESEIQNLDDDCFLHNSKMQELNLNGVQLKRFSIRILPLSIVFVHLPWSSIEEVDVSCQNSICHINYFDKGQYFENIRVFNGSRNQGTDISKLLQKFGSNVNVLDLSWNSISSLSDSMLTRFTNLEYLNLSHSSIFRITDYAFVRQFKLISLDLSYNVLNEIDYVDFTLPALKELNLVGNKLQKLGTINLINLPKLKILEISRNPLNSRYLTQTLSEWVKQDNLEIDVNLDTTQSATMIRKTFTRINSQPKFITRKPFARIINESKNQTQDISADSNEISSLIWVYIGIGILIAVIVLLIIWHIYRVHSIKTTAQFKEVQAIRNEILATKNEVLTTMNAVQVIQNQQQYPRGGIQYQEDHYEYIDIQNTARNKYDVLEFN